MVSLPKLNYIPFYTIPIFLSSNYYDTLWTNHNPAGTMSKRRPAAFLAADNLTAILPAGGF